MKIAVVGIGYVGLSVAVLLALSHEVVLLDIDPSRVAQINARQSPVQDAEITHALLTQPLRLRATLEPQVAYASADYVVIATPTDFDPRTGRLDTTSVEAVIREAKALAPQAVIVIRSTVPVGFTDSLEQRMEAEPALLFAPEFLREGRALHDNLHPSRIVVGGSTNAAHAFAALLQEGAQRPGVPLLITTAREAEAIKLFSNAYLAMRVAFFNEMDSFAETHQMDARHLVDGLCADPRIGTHYNNPSFGYGGYCLPKDTKQLQSHFHNMPHDLVSAIVHANKTRQQFIAQRILQRRPQRVGVFRLVHKEGSDNVRTSSVQGVMEQLRDQGVEVQVYEPTISTSTFYGYPVVNDLATFKRSCDLIVANRTTNALADVSHKVYTRDLFGRD